MSLVADGVFGIGARIEKFGISEFRAQPGFEHQNLLSLHDIRPQEKKTGNALIAHALSIALRMTHISGSSMASVALVVVDRNRCPVAKLRG